MAALESCPKHNMIAYLEKTEGNVEFHEVIDFLREVYIIMRHCQRSKPRIKLLRLRSTSSRSKLKPVATKGLYPKKGMKKAKRRIQSVQKDPLFDVMPEDKIDHMETENAQSEGRTREMVDEDKEIDEERLSTEDVTEFLLRAFKSKKEMQFTIEERAKFLHDTIGCSEKVPCSTKTDKKMKKKKDSSKEKRSSRESKDGEIKEEDKGEGEYKEEKGKHRVLNSPCFLVKSWLVQDQTVLAGKDVAELMKRTKVAAKEGRVLQD
ncbi:hypothetical protein Tco_1042384 [Tanacetum coccineum]|uniref:Uncharacterized protein n=1 Tax=Tanacetum coccineum TaxID=301880 RepID=A0ABQ5GK22_9ASTR